MNGSRYMELPMRKHPRLKSFDYSSGGAYYVTIHTQKDAPILSKVVGCCAAVGQGLAPAADALAPGEAKIVLTQIGREAVQQLFALEERFPFVHVANYVIMPTHIHLLLCFDAEAAGQAPALRCQPLSAHINL